MEEQEELLGGNGARMEEQEELLGGNGAGIRVSTFDYSVENHFKEMDRISKLCGEAGTDSVDETEIHCYKSSVTFLSEWKHYEYYPRIIRFDSETDNSQQKCVLGGKATTVLIFNCSYGTISEGET